MTEPVNWLYPSPPALVRSCGEARLEIADAAREQTYSLDGSLARAARQALAQGGQHPLLAALGPAHPLPALLAQLAAAEARPLDAAAALRLDGFDTLFVELCEACNERCEHCYASVGTGRDLALDRRTGLTLLEDAAAMGFGRVQLTGGDPLLHPDLVELVARAAALGLPCCEIFSNGLALAPALLEALAPHRPAFAFSLYSHRPEVHDAVTRTAGSHAATLAALGRVVAAGLRARVAVVALARNADHLAQTAALARELGAHSVGVSPSRAVGRGQAYAGAMDLGEAPAEALPDTCEHLPRRGHGTLCVTARGEVIPCIFNRQDVLGRLGERRLPEIAAAPELPGPLADDPGAFLIASGERLQCPSCRLTALALRLAARP